MPSAAEFLDAPPEGSAPPVSASDFLDGRSGPRASDFLDQPPDEGIVHRMMNDVRKFGSAAGRYIMEGLQAIDANTAKQLANPQPSSSSYFLAKAGVAPAAAPEAAAEAQKSADYWKQRATDSDKDSGVDPQLAQTWDARLSGAGGQAFVMGAESLIPFAGLPVMAMHGALAAEAEAKNQGKTDEEAESAGVKSLIGLGIFGAGGKVAALGVAKLLPEGAPALTKFVSQFLGQDAANETSSRAIAAWDAASEAPAGHKLEAATKAFTNTTLESAALNTVYAAIGAAHEAGRGETPAKDSPQIISLSDVQLPKAEEVLNGQAPPEPVKVPFQQDPGIPFMAKSRIEDQLRALGITDDQMAAMSGQEATDLIYQKTEDRGPTTDIGRSTSEPEIAADPAQVARPEPQPKIDKRTAAAEAQARAAMEEELRSAGSDQGRELLDAVQQAGGLPSKTNEFRGAFAGELSRLEENMKPAQRKSLFKTDAPDVDELATRLRDHGFDVQTPDDVIELVENRLRNDKPIYGTPKMAAVFYSRAPRGWETADTQTYGVDKEAEKTKAYHREIASKWRVSADPAAVRDVAGLGKAVAQTWARSPETAGRPAPRLLPVHWPVSRLKPPEIAKAEALARVTGNKIVWFKNIRGVEEIDGASIGHPDFQGKFFVNIEAKDHPFHTLAAHEITHRMEADAPDLYREFEAAVLKAAGQKSAFSLRSEALQRFDNRMAAAGYAEHQFNRELVANFTEESLRDPARFAEALGSNPTLYQRVRQFISDLIEKIRTKLQRGEGPTRAREAIVDLKKAEAAMQRAFEVYRTHRITEEPSLNFEVAFSRDIPSQKDFEEAANSKEKMRGHIATVQRMTEVSPDVKQRVESWYSPINLQDVNDRANTAIDKMGLGDATTKFMRATKADADTLALGHHVAVRLDGLGRFDEAAMVRDAMAEKLTSPAQAMWFISTIAKTSPEGLIRQAQKVVTDQIRGDPEKIQLLQEIERLKGQLAAFPEGKAKEAATQIVIRQLANVNKPGQRLSAKQLDNLLERHKAGKLSEEDLANSLAKYLKVPRLSPENIGKIKRAQQAWAQTSDPIMKLRRGAEMMDAVYGLVPRNFWDKVRAAATISMILHGRMPVRIGASNLLQMAGQTFVDTINAVTIDPMMSIFTGKRTVTGPELKARMSGIAAPVEAFRAGYRDAAARELGTIKSFKEGVRTMLDLATMTTRGIQELTDINGRTSHVFSSRFGRLAEDAVTLLHNTVPYAFWNSAYKASMARQMRIAKADVPTAEMIANARLDANKAIFQNETAAYQMLRKVRRILDYPTAKITGGKYGIGTATIPFAKVPGAILTEGATWTPIGFVRSGWELFRPLFTKEGFRQKDFVDAFTKATVGTGAMVATGYWLAKLGIITAGADENKDVDAMRRSTGFGQFRVNASELKRRFLSGNFHTPMREPFGQNGDVTYSYNWIEPFAFPLAMGADIAHSQDKREIDLKKGKITSNAVVTALAAGAETLTTHPMLMNLEQLQRTAAEQGFAPAAFQMLANVPGNFIPSLVRQTSQYIDNVTRETRGGSMVDQDVSRLAVQIPWLSQKYPARYDVFGEAVQRYNYGENSLINIFFNPAQPDRIRKNPNVNELMNLWNATASSSALPGQVSRNITINKKQVQLDNEQLATYQRYVGRLSSAGITRLLASPEFASEPADIRESLIVQVLAAVQEAAKIDLFGQQQYSVGKKGQVRLASPYAFQQMQLGQTSGLNRPVSAEYP